MKLEQAEQLARKIDGELSPFCARSEIAGSIRRRRHEVSDIDLVVLPNGPTAREKIMERCARTARLIKGGEQYVVFELANGFQLDLWFAHNGTADLFDADPCNFGVLLLARTGSAMFNVWIAQQARERGLHFNPHRGILKRNEIVASADEADIFRALQLSPIRPEDRER